ncbi:MAG: hypothetical protein Q9160_007574 [Pyrenula sp. 1 TL-2023]
MDPISIIGFVGAVVKLGLDVGLTVNRFVQAAKEIDDTVRDLYLEIQGVSKCLSSLESTLNAPTVQALHTTIGDHKVTDLWTSVASSVIDCEKTLKHFRRLLKDSRPEGSTVLQQWLRQFKLDLKKEGISSLRGQLQTHQTSLNTSLLMIDVYATSLTSGLVVTEMLPRINALQDSVERLTKQEKLILTKSEYIPPSVPVLQSQAKRVINSAMTIAEARSIRSEFGEANMSEAGDALEPAAINRIATWVSNTPTLVKETHHLGTLQQSPQLIPQQSPNPSSEHYIARGLDNSFLEDDDDNEEDDLVLDFVRKYFADAKEHRENSELADAEDCYLRGLKKAETLSLHKQRKLNLDSIKLNLGLTAFERNHLDLAETYFRRLADECVNRRLSNGLDGSHGDEGLQACYFLAQIYLQLDELEAAEKYCMKSLQERWRMRARDPLGFHPSARLMSAIASKKGDEKDAKMYLDMTSRGLSSPTPPPSDPAPDRPLPAVPSRPRSDASSIALQSITKLDLSDPRNTQRDSKNSSRGRANTRDSVPSLRDSVTGPVSDQDAATIDTLVENGFDIDSRSFDPDSALLWAARHGEEMIMRQLISGLFVPSMSGEKKSKHRIVKIRTVDKANEEGFTPLILATIRGHQGAVEILLVADAKVNLRTKNDEKRAALHFAILRSHQQIVQSLIASGADLDIADSLGNTPLHLAVTKASPQVTLTLLKAGADHETRNYVGCTPLHLAVIERREESVECLIAHGVKVNAAISPPKPTNSASPISFSASWIDTAAPKPSIPPLQQPTALHLAATNGDTNIVSLLVSSRHRINLESRTSDGRTPLHAAVLASQLHTVSLLLDHGADIEAHDLHKRTSLHLVVGSGPSDMLISTSQTPSAQILILSHLLHRNASTAARESDGSTPLHIAAYEGDVTAVKVLLDAGADSEAKRMGNITAAELAKKVGQVEVMRIFEDRFGNGKKGRQGSSARKLFGLGMGRKLTA